MNSLQVDPKTGFLTSDNFNAFGSEQKLRLLELTEQFVKAKGKWPDLGGLCDAVGCDPRTLDRHLKIDAKFGEAFKNLTLRGKWKLESTMFDLSTKSPLYMFGWLRKFYPEEYNPEHRMTVTHETSVLTRLADEAKQAKDVREAEIVPNIPPRIGTP